jgi:hypothetical protein
MSSGVIWYGRMLRDNERQKKLQFCVGRRVRFYREGFIGLGPRTYREPYVPPRLAFSGVVECVKEGYLVHLSSVADSNDNAIGDTGAADFSTRDIVRIEVLTGGKWEKIYP